MNKIKKETILKAIKRAYKGGRQWAKIDWGYTYALMLNTSDANIWVDTFADENSWKEYHRDKAVVRLTEYGRTVKESEISLAEEVIAHLRGAGWEIED